MSATKWREWLDRETGRIDRMLRELEREYIRLEELAKPLERDRAVVPAGNYVMVQVSDEGGGIPPDKLQKVFEPFYTTRAEEGGTGLGLAVSYRIIERHQGMLTVESAPGQGATFIIRLPLPEPEDG